MVNSADFALKNVFINRDLSFLPRCSINAIPLKVNKLKEYFNVNTLAKKYLFTFSGGKSVYRARKPIKYIKLVQCYFFSSTNNSQDRFLSRCFGIEKAVKNLISKRNYSSLYVTTIRFSNHFLYIMNVVFRQLVLSALIWITLTSLLLNQCTNSPSAEILIFCQSILACVI